MTSSEGQLSAATPRRVAVVTLGCARNEVDSEELAGRLAGDGYELVQDAEDADAVLVNTCGFIESAKKDSVDAILAATDSGAEVIAVGCMAERYGSELAGALPEATVLGFDDYAAIGGRLDDVLARRPLGPHTPRHRRPPRRRARRPPAGAAHAPRPAHAAADQPGAAHRGHGGGRRAGHPRARLAATEAPGVPPVGRAQTRLRVRPALLVLRAPHLPRRLRLAPAGRGARRGTVA